MSVRISACQFWSGISSIIFRTRVSILILYTDVEDTIKCIHLLYINALLMNDIRGQAAGYAQIRIFFPSEDSGEYPIRFILPTQ